MGVSENEDEVWFHRIDNVVRVAANPFTANHRSIVTGCEERGCVWPFCNV